MVDGKSKYQTTFAHPLIKVNDEIGSLGNVLNTLRIEDIVELSNFDGKGWKISEINLSEEGDPAIKLTEKLAEEISANSNESTEKESHRKIIRRLRFSHST